ncbi:hypothetical protein [Sphaerisporangium fuscum]|uniref:hypothetical protein n=1 Tax=Sphaerisporangium fuscum TaxID=2835868 RepID=UPI001BDC3100|nr:hypothetical protein [Sphaerisporangium fuscum]
MAKDRTSITLDEWVLDLARKHAEREGISVSAVVSRGILREVAATHDPRARAALYGPAAAAGQEADERITAEDIAAAADIRRAEEAA